MRDRERGTRTRPPSQDQSSPDQVLDALLAGAPLPGEDQAGLQPVADVLAALRAPAAPAELTGQASALAAFRAQPRRAHSHRARRALWPRPVTALAAGVVVAALATSAYEGDLPAPVQQWAHHTFGLTAARTKAKPAPRHPQPSATPDPTPVPSHPHRSAKPSPAPPGPRRTEHRDGQRSGGRDGRQHDGQPGGPGPSSGGPGSSPSPSDHNPPQPSTSPAAQPSAQSSTSPGSPHQHSSPSSSP